MLFKAIRAIKNWNDYVALYFNKINSEHVILEMRSGTKIKLRVNSTDLMAFTHVWLLKEYERPGFEIKDNDIVIDVGGHIGLFALFAAQFCKSGKIYCFEPIKENFDMLKANTELNHISNITYTNAAISKDDGTVTIYLNDDESGHSMYGTGTRSVQVKAISLQTVFDSNRIDSCDFLKIDCEGEEYAIMDSLPPGHYNKIKKMCIEYHFADTKPHLLDVLLKKLEAFSFDIKTRMILPDIGFLYAKK
ncbi:MAG: FkbM family methyltransferase [Thaumarchaeota archaeon]|nr:FkbM family methyltransferase [Nitrososphaerota archaeon]